MDAAVEVAITRQDGGGVEIAVDDLLLDRRVQRARHAVAGGAGEGDDAEAELFELGQQPGFLQIEACDDRAGGEAGLHPGLADEAEFVGLLGDEAGGDDVARVRRVGAAGDRGDNDGAVGQQPLAFLRLRLVEIDRNTACPKLLGGQAAVRIGRPGEVTLDGRKVEFEHALVLGGLQRVRPQAGVLGVGFYELHLRGLAAGEQEIIDCLLIDVEHGGRRAIFRAHVRDGRAVADRQAVSALAEEFEPGADHALLAEEFGDRENDVGGGDARLALAGELHADNVGEAHHRRAAEHHGLGLKPADADGDDAKRIDVRRVAVGADAGVGEGDAVTQLHDRRHLLQVDLVHDAVAGGDHVDVLERLLGPLDEVEAILVAAILDRAVLLKRLRIEAAMLDGEAVVDDQLSGNNRIDLGRVAALIGDRVAQTGEVHQRRLAEDVVADDAGRIPGEIEIALPLDDLRQRVGEHGGIAAAHQLLGQHARDIGQAIVRAGADRLDRFSRVEEVDLGTG